MSKKHGWKNTRLYNSWRGMKSRCNNPNDTAYHHYGGRGITVCEEWLNFENFREWALHNGYEETLTIERKDVNKGYSPDNCEWVSVRAQHFNTRDTIMVEGKCLAILAEEAGLKYATVLRRYHKGERDLKRLLRGLDLEPHLVNGKSLLAISQETGINYGTLRYRWDKGLRSYEELTKPVEKCKPF